MRDGTYHNSWFNSMIRIDEDGRLRACSRGESRCRSLGVAGNTEVPTGYISKSVPDELADDLPDLSTANIRHSLDFDAFLNLDERPVAYRAFGYEDGEESCKFIVLHPEHGYQISHTMPCTERSNWRADLRAIIADLSQRTISYQRASCAMPPINARITPSLHSADIDSQQAMRDWAVARDLAPGQ